MVAGLQFNFYHQLAGQLDGNRLATAVDFASFSGTLAWVKSAGYLLLFAAMVIEGPVVTAAAAFAAALGFFNIYIIFVLSILGDLAGDFAYYAIGYFGRVAFVERYGHRIGLTTQRLERMEHLIKTHPKKTLAAIKLAPILPAPGLMMIGAVKMPFGRYTAMTILVTLPKSLLFMLLGFYFGRAYDRIAASLQSGAYFIVVGLALVLAAFYAYQKLAARLSVRLETI